MMSRAPILPLMGIRLTLLAGVLALMACAPAEPVVPKAPESPVAPAAAAAPQPKRGGVFQVAAPRPLPHLDAYIQGDSNVGIFLDLIYETLVKWDYKDLEDWRVTAKVMPNLAEKWEQPNPTIYIFHIRKGVKWHDGNPLTAGQVAWAFDYMRNPEKAFRVGSELRPVESVKALDDTRVQITTKEPSPSFLETLTDYRAAILPQHVAEREGDFRKVAIGTGPFKLESFDPQKGTTYLRNEDYWAKGQPYLDRVKMFTGLDRQGLIAAFVAKQSDILKQEDKAQVDAVTRVAQDAMVFPYKRDNEVSISFKLDRPPFNDVRVRRAVHLAIDRKKMIDTLTFGLGLATTPGVNPARTGYALSQEELGKLPGWRQPKDQDLAEAKRLLTEAGYPQGLSLKLKFDSTHSTALRQAEMAAAHLRAVGINAELVGQERGVYNKTESEGDYEAIINTLTSWNSEGDWNVHLHSKGALNKRPIRDPELDALIEAAQREFDEAKRKKIYRDVQENLLKNVYVVPTVLFASFQVRQPYVHGWIENFGGSPINPDWTGIWLDVEKVPPGR